MRFDRRTFLGGAGGLAVGAGVAVALESSSEAEDPSQTVDFYGERQAGIVTPT